MHRNLLAACSHVLPVLITVPAQRSIESWIDMANLARPTEKAHQLSLPYQTRIIQCFSAHAL